MENLRNLLAKHRAILSRPFRFNEDHIGAGGPFKYVYDGFSRGWLARLDAHFGIEREVFDETDQAWMDATDARVFQPDVLEGLQSREEGIAYLDDYLQKLYLIESQVVKEVVFGKTEALVGQA